jgi:Na+/proline symporter
VFAYSVGIDYVIGVLIGALIVCIYVPMGGFMATTATDVIQGIIMIASTILLVPLVFSVAGGLPEISVKMAAIDPKYNQVFYGTWTPVAAFCVALYWLMWYVAAPYLGRLYISLKKPDWREVVKFGVFFQLGQTFGMLLWYTGFAALALGIKPKPPFGYDLAIVEFGIRYTPPILTPLLGLAFVGILAAVLSSVEDFIHNASVELGHTVIGELIPSLRRKEVASLWICRIIVWGIVVVAIVYAIISPPPLLSIFMYYVAGPLLAASFISLMIGLYHRNAIKIAVEIAAIASIAGTLASYFILPPVYTGHFSVPPSFGLMIGLIVYGIMHLYLRAKKSSK